MYPMFTTPSPISETPGATPSMPEGVVRSTTPPLSPAVGRTTSPISPASDSFSPKHVFSGSDDGIDSGSEASSTPKRLRDADEKIIQPGELNTSFMNQPPSVEEGLLETDVSDDIYREANDTDVALSFSNNNRTLYYCNGKVFYSMYGALRENSIEWPEKPVYECHMMPWKMHYTRKCKLPRVSEHMSVYFNRRNSNELFEDMNQHVSIRCSKNPFQDPYKTIWINMEDVFASIITSPVDSLVDMLKEKYIIVTQGFDICNICWSVQSKLSLGMYDDNKMLFWKEFESMLKDRFMVYSKASGLKNRFITFRQFCVSIRKLLIMASEKNKENRRDRYKRRKIIDERLAELEQSEEDAGKVSTTEDEDNTDTVETEEGGVITEAGETVRE